MVSPEPNRQRPGERALVEMHLTGHLTRESLNLQLLTVEQALTGGSEQADLLVDCQSMSGYDTAARERFVEWNRKMRSTVRRLAVVTNRTMWHLVVSGMGLASGRAMKAFDTTDAAKAWLQT